MEGLANLNLRIERDCDLGAGWVEGLFCINEIFAYLGLQAGIPETTVRARIIEAAGYCHRPPKSGDKVIVMEGKLYSLDNNAIRAMRRVIFDFVGPNEVDVIIGGYLDDRFGDPYNIALYQLEDCVHPHIVMAVLDELDYQGVLPIHPSREFGA